MNSKIFNIFSLFEAGLVLLLFVSCGPTPFLVTITPKPTTAYEILATPLLETPTPPGSEPSTPTASPTCQGKNWPCSSESMTMTAEMGPTLAARLTGTPICNWPCSRDGLTLTAAIDSTLAAAPSNEPPPWATVIPSAGDLGWGSIYGRIIDGITTAPIDGAIVKCEHFSYTSPYLCNRVTTTNSNGLYVFTDIFFHDTDQITLIVEAPGYTPLRFEQSFFTQAELHADLGLFLVSAGSTLTPTATPIIMCTPPACSGGKLSCGNPNGCPGGCGTVCTMPTP
jgi:hypothetical protein